MARKVKRLTIKADGRDAGKVFVLTEMPARQAEKWAMRAFSAIGRSGTLVPDDAMAMGMVGIAVVGMRAIASVAFEDAEPLMDEMLGCVEIAPDKRHPELTRALVESDIEEVATLVAIREALLELHTGFSIRAELSKLRAEARDTKSEPNSPTSLGSSE